ncbi:MAG: hypothetical protein LAP21_25320 [Acidobacteriia bacterium]|nr:hypothetical protein [Terriglobia bacterium]
MRKRKKNIVPVKSANIPSVFQSRKELFAKVRNPKPLQGGHVGAGPNREPDWLGDATQQRDSQAKRKGRVYPVEVGSKKYKKHNKKFLRKIVVNEAKEVRRLVLQPSADENAPVKKTPAQFEFKPKVDLSTISKPGDVRRLLKESTKQQKTTKKHKKRR